MLTELVVKIKILDEARKMYRRSVEDKEEQWSRFETFYISSGPSGIGKSKFAKDLARK